jgi:hypothetical protein
MNLQEAKEILERYITYKWGRGPDRPDSRDVKEALDVAIQCLEDSIEGFQLMESKKIAACNKWTNSRSCGNKEENRNTYYDFLNGIEWAINEFNVK